MYNYFLNDTEFFFDKMSILLKDGHTQITFSYYKNNNMNIINSFSNLKVTNSDNKELFYLENNTFNLIQKTYVYNKTIEEQEEFIVIYED